MPINVVGLCLPDNKGQRRNASYGALLEANHFLCQKHPCIGNPLLMIVETLYLELN
ncbi:MAG: hypothetical protein ACR5K4_01935 [Sodalis sp. (in: enterobacteria)]